MKKYILLISVVIITVACKNSENSDRNATVLSNKTKLADKELEVVMEFKTNQDGEIKLMLEDIKIDEFQTKNIHLIEQVYPSTDVDKIVGKFGYNNISNKMIISLGNEKEKEFEIISLQFKYGEKIVNIAPKNLNKYFGFSKFTVFDSSASKIKTIRVDNAHYPRLYVKKKLWDELKTNL